ncbi:efflux RND transporter periplasmic adaptor subunit [Ferrimonas marina]|uniref:RND family efflux transporter, MFP subunit n=1 Tax=Ferrimonas marina TaxID=299255 RepID=A0A1M5VTM7_9GAMM|nr:efflux RND transporter periplasmic adaptor subunit [Ferrimonas marina]SHH78615.1 RND family efflux transporter, MFP subunit [Ferrimonas marina]
MSLILRRLAPLLILVLFIVLAIVLGSMREPPEKKEQTETLPIVEVMEVSEESHQLVLRSYGVVRPKHQTQLVAEISGRLVELSPKFVAGEWVRKGDLLARIEPADYQADLMQAQAGLATAQAQLEEEIARGKVAEKEWRGVIDGIPPELGLRKPQLAKEQANVRSAEATLARAQRNLERTEIRAPFDGLITERVVDLGQYVNVSLKLGMVEGTDIAEIRLPVAPEELGYLDQIEGAQVDLAQDLGGRTEHWQARLVRSEGVINDGNRMVYLVAEIKDPYGINTDRIQPLKFGSFVNARIAGIQLDGLVNLPRFAVRSQRVTVVKSDNTVELRPVEVVRADLERVYIRTELAPGDRISLNAMDAIDNGRKVKVAGEEGDAQGTGTAGSQLTVAGAQ